jgi:aldehyde:ferredoxin oxidoreductase
MNNISENAVIKPPKSQFIENVQKWVLIDKQLKIVNEKTKRMRELKHDLADNICKYMNENNMKNKKISITGGELKMYDKKDYSPLNYGYIEKCLGEIIPDKTHVEYIINYLKENREISVSQELRGNYTNE